MVLKYLKTVKSVVMKMNNTNLCISEYIEILVINEVINK